MLFVKDAGRCSVSFCDFEHVGQAPKCVRVFYLNCQYCVPRSLCAFCRVLLAGIHLSPSICVSATPYGPCFCLPLFLFLPCLCLFLLVPLSLGLLTVCLCSCLSVVLSVRLSVSPRFFLSAGLSVFLCIGLSPSCSSGALSMVLYLHVSQCSELNLHSLSGLFDEAPPVKHLVYCLLCADHLPSQSEEDEYLQLYRETLCPLLSAMDVNGPSRRPANWPGACNPGLRTIPRLSRLDGLGAAHARALRSDARCHRWWRIVRFSSSLSCCDIQFVPIVMASFHFLDTISIFCNFVLIWCVNCLNEVVQWF